MDVARFNFSHGGPNVQQEGVANLRAVSQDIGQPVALLQDLQGPKIRTGPIEGGILTLVAGQTFTLTTRSVPGDATEVSTTYPALPNDCETGDNILLDDGLLSLRVERVDATDVICTVVHGGPLKPNKGINLPYVKVSAPALSEKDRHDVEWGIANDFDFVALSFVRRAEDIQELREIIKARNSSMQIIAKIEKPEAIDNLDEIIEAADGVMVARGDLGVEMAPEEVPLLQKRIIQKANQAGKIVITATQMLETMTTNPRPTRAEASDVVNAILDGTDAVMLSGETAMGAYPVETVQMMARLVEEVETSTADIWYERRQSRRPVTDFPTAICEATAHAAAGLKARVIACYTESGSTARLLAKFRPPVPIIAFTVDPKVARQMQLVWGVRPFITKRTHNTDDMIQQADHALQRCNWAKPGDNILVTLGAPVALCGSTNLMKLHRIGEADIK